ncbi:MAG: hypothetical protein B7Z80_10355 [Rhodospirillales bacterium 20-64-7]|nr:MAG: hypothetical protein B7Z80_10355 [Rhodospirillales bacterium 20-64-7]
MFDSYEVAVRLTLINGVTSGLLSLSRQFARVHTDATALQGRLERMGIAAAKAGAAMAVGGFGLGLISKALKPAEEYAHQLNILNMAGLKQAEIAQLVGTAWANTRTVITTTATENLRTLLDLRNVFGTIQEARMALPTITKMQTVLASSSEGQISGNSKELGYSMAKLLDILGKAQDPATFETWANGVTRVIEATQGRVTPESMKSTLTYARQARYGLDYDFVMTLLPSLIQEYASSGGGSGGGSRGVGPMLAALYRVTNQGYINKAALPLLKELHLVDPRTALKTTTQGTTVGMFTGAQLAAANPFEWVQKVLMPAIEHHYGGHATKQQIQGDINSIFRGNQLAAALALEFAMKPLNFYRDQKIIQGTMAPQKAYETSIANDPNAMHKALEAQWTNVKTIVGMQLLPAFLPFLKSFASALEALATWMQNHTGIVKALTWAFVGLSGVMLFGGAIGMLRVAFQGLAMVLQLGSFGLLPAIATGLRGLAVGALPLAATGISSLGTAFVALLPILAQVMALVAAAGAGYLVGKGINAGVDWAGRKLTGEKDWSLSNKLGGLIFDMTGGNTAAKRALAPIPLRAPSQRETDYLQHPASQRSTVIHLHNKINLDGKTTAESISKFLLPNHSRGPTTFNPAALPLSPGMTAGGM